MLKWLHHLFNPHCEHCSNELRESMICESCEVLKAELAAVRFENRQLMQALLDKVNPKLPEQTSKNEVHVPINNSVPWRVRQQLLETEDRKKANIIREKKLEDIESSKSTEQLEKELGVADNG